MDTWIAFADLCRDSDRLTLAEKTLTSLVGNSYNALDPEVSDLLRVDSMGLMSSLALKPHRLSSSLTSDSHGRRAPMTGIITSDLRRSSICATLPNSLPPILERANAVTTAHLYYLMRNFMASTQSFSRGVTSSWVSGRRLYGRIPFWYVGASFWLTKLMIARPDWHLAGLLLGHRAGPRMVSSVAYLGVGELRGHHSAGSLTARLVFWTLHIVHHSGGRRLLAKYRAVARQLAPGYAAIVDALVHLRISTRCGDRYQRWPADCQHRRMVRGYSTSKSLGKIPGAGDADQLDHRPYSHSSTSHPKLDCSTSPRYR